MTCQCVCILQVAMTHNLFVPLATISNFHSASRQVFNSAAKYANAPPKSKMLNLEFLIFIFWEISRAAQEGQVYGWILVQTPPNPAQISTDCMMIFDICVLALAHVIPESRRSTNSSFPLLALLRNHTSANPDIQTTSRTRNAAIKNDIELKRRSPLPRKEGSLTLGLCPTLLYFIYRCTKV